MSSIISKILHAQVNVKRIKFTRPTIHQAVVTILDDNNEAINEVSLVVGQEIIINMPEGTAMRLGPEPKNVHITSASDPELRECYLCKGPCLFHGIHSKGDCPGCHRIECIVCLTQFDLGSTVDPHNNESTLEDLKRKIAIKWNNRP